MRRGEKSKDDENMCQVREDSLLSALKDVACRKKEDSIRSTRKDIEFRKKEKVTALSNRHIHTIWLSTLDVACREWHYQLRYYTRKWNSLGSIPKVVIISDVANADPDGYHYGIALCVLPTSEIRGVVVNRTN
ncbi:hypothetical protein PR048_005940 [Dryococelus australis]|uniref:Uncharacterized protein n=1 Tax=Dryococelus australis TaxID=614101 RepID=A0ABQ9IAM4_9NEOP|nr:hypothetical protein PR048_005940 [Dryococelus australis]